MLLTAQLYVFSKMSDPERQIDGILKALAAAGYQAVEGMYRLPPQQADALARHGLLYFAPHLTPNELDPLDPALTFCRAMGAGHICTSGLLEWNSRSAGDYRRSAAALNDLGRRLRGEGLRLLYHNHEFEFEKVEGATTGMDILLELLDPCCVRLCLDIGWLWCAGANPVRFLREHGARIAAVHLRDFKGKASVALGRGDVDLPSILDAVRQLPHLEALVVEQDPATPDPLGDMLASRAYLAAR